TVAGDETAVLRRLHDLGERLVTDDAAARDAVVEVALEDVEIGATDAHATHAQQRLAACRRRHGDGAGREPPRPVVKGRAHGRRSHLAKGSTTGSLGTSESERRPRPRKTEHARLSPMGAPGEGAPCVRSITARAAALGVPPGRKAADAAHARLAAPPGGASPEPIVDRSRRVVLDTPDGRIVLVDSMIFASPANHNDVMCCGSHGGRVNMARALEIRPRGALFSDGGGAPEGSGVNGLPLLDAAEVAAATVDAMRARIGDPA